MLSAKLANELCLQVNREYQAAYLYFSMAVYADSKNMDGFANWMKIQSQEEISHGMKIYNYLKDMGAKIELFPLPKPQTDFSSFRDLLEVTLKSEQEIAEHLNRIAAQSLDERDMITYSFLEWFLKEQIEEISHSTSVLEKVKLVGEEAHGLLLINSELKQRKPEAEEK